MWSCLGDAEIAPLTRAVIVFLCRTREAEVSASVAAVTETLRPVPSGTPCGLSLTWGSLGVSRSEASQEGLTDRGGREGHAPPLPGWLMAGPKAVSTQEVLRLVDKGRTCDRSQKALWAGVLRK